MGGAPSRLRVPRGPGMGRSADEKEIFIARRTYVPMYKIPHYVLDLSASPVGKVNKVFGF